MDNQGFNNIKDTVVEMGTDGGVFTIWRNTNQTGGFDHCKVYLDKNNGEETKPMTTRELKKYYRDMGYTGKENKPLRDNMEVVDLQAHYKQEGAFKNICSFEFSKISIDSNCFLFDDQFKLAQEFIEKNEDVIEINGETISCFDGRPYDVFIHNENKPKSENSTKKQKVEEAKQTSDSLEKELETLSNEELIARTRELMDKVKVF